METTALRKADQAVAAGGSRSALANTPRSPAATWDGLIEGDTVELSRNGIPESTAVVEAIGEDRAVLWVWLDGGMGRKMIHASDDIHLKLMPPG